MYSASLNERIVSWGLGCDVTSALSRKRKKKSARLIDESSQFMHSPGT